jgi:hypothetical protein
MFKTVGRSFTFKAIGEVVMGIFGRPAVAFFAAFLGLYAMVPAPIQAQQKKDMGGWEKDSAYNKFYNFREIDNFKAEVVEVTEVVPMPGMSPAVALKVRESPDEIVTVHLCPAWFVDPANIGIKKGDKIKIRGCWAEIEGKDVFLASKVKKGDYFDFKVRLTKDGTPFWTMSPEELARERAAK